MSQTTQPEKSLVRSQVQARMRNLTTAYRAEASLRARCLLESQEVWRKAKSILFYAPMQDELDIWPLLEVGVNMAKDIALPCFDNLAQCYRAGRIVDLEEDVKIGRFGIREPTEAHGQIPINLLDLILVPGVAFDMQGGRVGRGRGYYDRLASTARGKKCGIAFDEQIVPKVPLEPHDILMDCILTPTRWTQI